MALTLLTRSYTSTYAGFVVVVKDENGVPARLYNSARGGLLSKDGRVKLPATGVLNAYVQDEHKYTLSLLSAITNQTVSNEHDVDAGATQAPVSGDARYTRGAGTSWFGFPVSGATYSFQGSAGLGTGAFVRGAGFERACRLVPGVVAGDIKRVVVTNASAAMPLMSATDTIFIKFRVSSCKTGDLLSLFLSADNMSTSRSTSFALNPDKVGEWIVPMVVSDISGAGAPITGQLNSAWFQVTNTSGGTPPDITIDGVWLNDATVATLSMDYDDGFLSQYTEIFSYMSSKGLVGNIAVTASTVGKVAGDVDAFDYCTLEMLREMKAAGWGMLVHGYTPMTSLADEAARRADIKANRDYMLETGLVDWNDLHYVFPAGKTTSDVNGILSDLGFRSARVTQGNRIGAGRFGLVNPYRCFASPIADNSTVANHISRVDAAIAQNAIERMYGHRVKTSAVTDAANEMLQANYRAFIDAVALRRDAGSLRVRNWFDTYQSIRP